MRVRSALRKWLFDDRSLEAARSPSWPPSFPCALSMAPNHVRVGVHPDLFALAALPSQIDARVSTPAPSAPCAVRRIECARTSGDVTTRRSEWLPRLVCGFLSDAPASCAISRQPLASLAVSSMSSRRSPAASPVRQATLQAASTIFERSRSVMYIGCVLEPNLF